MPNNPPTLHLVCGKIAAGKTTLCRQLAENPKTVLIGEDDWMARLFRDEIRDLSRYVEYSGRLRAAMREHIVDILRGGLSVALDFPGNTLIYRLWMRGLFESAGVAHRLHVLDTPDALCKARMQRRNGEGAHPFAATEEDFERMLGWFRPPTPDEGFDVTIHRPPEVL
jgi:predicted kinase